MAELIPVHYLMRAAARRRLERWTLVGLLVAGLCAAAVLSSYAMDMRHGAELAQLQRTHQERRGLIARAHELCSQRQILARRMETIQQLKTDRTLLVALATISRSFASHDRLESLLITNNVEARDKDSKTATVPGSTAQVMGITANSATMAELMSRLGQGSDAATNVSLLSSRRETFLDSQVMRFQLLCQRAAAAGSASPSPAAPGKS